jgi:Mn2+/Fe2+ NRAMP family transporter
MIQNLNVALITLASIVGLVIVIAAWVVTAAALHERQQRKTHIDAIEQHLADVAGRTPAAKK